MRSAGWVVARSLSKWLILIAAITMALYFALAPIKSSSSSATPSDPTSSPTVAPEEEESSPPTTQPDNAPTSKPTRVSVSSGTLLSAAPSLETIAPSQQAPTTHAPTSASNPPPLPTLTPTAVSLTPPELEYVGNFKTNSSLFPLGQCQGDCNKDRHCQLGLACFHRGSNTTQVPGCAGELQSGVDVCFAPPPGWLVTVARSRKSRLFPLAACMGRCRRDEDCKGDLICYTRQDDEAIEGCVGEGIPGASYCTVAPPPVPPPTDGPPTPPRKNKPLVVQSTECSPLFPCQRCHGDCNGDNNNCQPGLACFPRTVNEKVPGCFKGGDDDVAGVDFCYKPSEATSKGMTYVPGEATVVENGLLLSTGLTAKCIATTGEKVQYYGGGESEEEFHEDPDGAAIFADTQTGGYIYVSNAEVGKEGHGGVGAITFNSDGQVVGYKKLTSATRRNCGGGKTFWNTWISCEEDEGGQVWEIDPWGNRDARKTLIGVSDGDLYESAAYDNRDVRFPKFYVTVDNDEGAIVKFEPDQMAVEVALSTDPPDYSNLLHTNDGGTATREFLLIRPESENEEKGTYSWTENLEEARQNAKDYYQNCEGIDVRKGFLYFTCKRDKVLFILNLDSGTYERESLKSGAFGNGPDQVSRLLGKDGDILYFCEDGGKEAVCGVHGRDINGKLYSILESYAPENIGETSGLAFSPDNMRMYVSFQGPGKIFEVTRKDGFPFGGQRLDIKYHSNEKNVFAFPDR